MLLVHPPDTENEHFFFVCVQITIAFHVKEFHAVYIKMIENVIKLGDNKGFFNILPSLFS